MKFKTKIRQPKKPKKVTLERIREIVKEELASLQPPIVGFQTIPAIRDEESPKLWQTLSSSKSFDGGKEIHMPFTYPIKPVPPPPGVKNLDNPPPVALPNGYETEDSETITERPKEPV